MYIWIKKTKKKDVRDPGLIPESRRSPGEGNGNPLQYSCRENPMEGGALCATVHGFAKSQTRLSDFTYYISTIVWGKHLKLFVRCKFKTSVVRLPLIIEYTESTYTSLCLRTLYVLINWAASLLSFLLVLLLDSIITCEISIYWLEGFLRVFLVLYMCVCNIIIYKLQPKHMHIVICLWSTSFVTNNRILKMIFPQRQSHPLYFLLFMNMKVSAACFSGFLLPHNSLFFGTEMKFISLVVNR